MKLQPNQRVKTIEGLPIAVVAIELGCPKKTASSCALVLSQWLPLLSVVSLFLGIHQLLLSHLSEPVYPTGKHVLYLQWRLNNIKRTCTHTLSLCTSRKLGQLMKKHHTAFE